MTNRNRPGSLLRLLLLALVIAALVVFVWLAMDTIAHQQTVCQTKGRHGWCRRSEGSSSGNH
jgi:hypothetical protein